MLVHKLTSQITNNFLLIYSLNLNNLFSKFYISTHGVQFYYCKMIKEKNGPQVPFSINNFLKFYNIKLEKII